MVIDIGNIVKSAVSGAGNIVRGLNQNLNPSSALHRTLGTSSAMWATITTFIIWYLNWYFGIFGSSLIITWLTPLLIFLFFFMQSKKLILTIGGIHLIILTAWATFPTTGLFSFVGKIIGVAATGPVWPIIGIIIFMSRYQQAEERGQPIPSFVKVAHFLIILILISFLIGYAWDQISLDIQTAKIVQSKEAINQVWNFVKDNIVKSFNIVRYSFVCISEQTLIGRTEPIDQCVKEKLDPPENATITGATDITIQEVVKAELKDAPYLTTEFGTQEAFEVGAVLEVFNPKKTKIDIEVKCEIKDIRLKTIESKIIGSSVKVQDDSSIVKYEIADRLTADLICSPKDSKTLAQGSYFVTFTATIKNIPTQAKLVNLFMAKDALTSLIRDYAQERKITVTSATEAAVMRSLFPGLIATYYKSGKVESQASPGFIKPALETDKSPIIGYEAEYGTIGLKIGVTNEESGTAGNAVVRFTLPEDLGISDGHCYNYQLVEGTTKTYEYRNNNNNIIDLTKLKKGGQPQALPGCFIDTSKIRTLNPNVPEPRTFVVDITYDYTLKKDLSVKVRNYGYDTATLAPVSADANARFDTDPSATKEKVIKYVRTNAWEKYKETGEFFYNKGVEYGIDPGFAIGVATVENSFGNNEAAKVARECNNLFSVEYQQGRAGQTRPCPANNRFGFYDDPKDSIEAFYKLIKDNYVNKYEQNTVAKMIAPAAYGDSGTCKGSRKDQYFCCTLETAGHCYCCDTTSGYNNWLNAAEIRKKVSET